MIQGDTEAERVVINFFNTLSTGDLEKLRETMHPDAAWNVMVTVPGAGSHKGRDTIIDFLGPIRGQFMPGDPKVNIDRVISKGDIVAVESHSSGHFKNGTEYKNNYCWFVIVKDGKVFEIREYMDSYHVSTLKID